MKITPPGNPVIDAEVDLNTGEGDYFLRARLNVSLPGLERGVAQRLLETAHRTCPYSGVARQRGRLKRERSRLGRRAVHCNNRKSVRSWVRWREPCRMRPRCSRASAA